MNTINDKYIETYIKKNVNYYKKKFEYLSNGNKLSWNWAGLLNIGFLFYRKMFLELVLTYFYLVLVGIAINELLGADLSDRDKFIYLIIYPLLTVSLWLPFVSNYLYYMKFKRALANLNKFRTKESKLEYLSKAGGVSIEIEYLGSE